MLERTVLISGGFDPIHLGHIALIKEARMLANTGQVIVVVDSDEYVSSKHKLMFPQAERVALVESLAEVDAVFFGTTADGDCTEILQRYPPDIYLVGPDHSNHRQLPEFNFCELTHIRILTAMRPRLKNWHSSDYAPTKWKNPIVTISGLLSSPQGLLITTRGLSPNRGTLEVPGGFLEIDETLEEGVRRETREEIGVEIDYLKYFMSIRGKYSDSREIISVYFTGNLAGTPKMSDECISLDYFNKVPSKSFFNSCDLQAVQNFFDKGIPCV